MTQPALASTPSRGMRTYHWPPQPPHEFEVVGVTSCIGGGIPKPFLAPWSAKMVAEFAVDHHDSWAKLPRNDAVDLLKRAPYRSTSAKADRGTIVHAAIDAYLAGKAPTKDELRDQLAEARVPENMWKAAAGMFAGAIEFLFELEPEVIQNEATVYSRQHGYAGTMDLLVKMRIGRSTKHVVVDFKTSKRIYDETSIQLCAYSRADFIGLNDGTEVKMPKNVRDGIAVRLMASGKFEPVAFTLSDELFDVFLAAKRVACGKGIIEGARRPRF